MGNLYRRGFSMKKSSENTRLAVITIMAVLFGLLVGLSFRNFSIIRLRFVPDLSSTSETEKISFEKAATPGSESRIYVESNPRGAESLPPGIVVAETDFYLRRLWGEPKDDFSRPQKYLATFTVGFDQSTNISKAIKKFSEDFTILLFHYDGRASDWKQFEWSKQAIHVSVEKQTKWWFAKRFLHPDVVAAYDYIFIWDENLELKHFDAEKYLKIVKKHGLEISQPGLEPNSELTWEMTKRRPGTEVHKETSEKAGWCTSAHLPPCAAFVQVMAPVFSRAAWRCVWHMIQNDYVYGLGLEFALRRCVEPADEKIGVVDNQWVIYQIPPSPDNQILQRINFEQLQFEASIAEADRVYVAEIRGDQSDNSTDI